MKKMLIMWIALLPGILYAQKLPDDGSHHIRIVEADRIIQAEIMTVEHLPKPKTDRFYFWYGANLIHSTEGGFSGKLLNGRYNEYFINKNLKQQGNFEDGLKQGIWKSWTESGDLKEVMNWKKGHLIPKDTRSFWQKLNVFKRRNKNSLDTLKFKKTD